MIDVLTLYVRERCHLCEEMQAALGPWQERLGFKLELVDVDDDLALVSRFGDRVPVLAQGEREICHYRLDERALLEALDGSGRAKA